MEFRFEDILKNIIPGGILAFAAAAFFLGGFGSGGLKNLLASDLKEYGEIVLIRLLVTFYLLGHFIDALASLFEFYVVHELIGRPSYKLLTGRGYRIKLINYKEVVTKINSKFPNENFRLTGNKKHDIATASKIFKYANAVKSSNENSSLLKEHYYSYVFSRNLFFSVLISSIVVAYTYWSQISYVTFSTMAIILVLLYVRRRDRDYYYSREVLLVASFQP